VSSAPSGTAAKIFILIPKKIVRLATRRNRIRRLIREAVRMETFFKSAGKIYSFRVMKFPEAPRLWEVKKLIGELMEQQKQTPRTPLIRGE
jgi:RNase P protein component